MVLTPVFAKRKLTTEVEIEVKSILYSLFKRLFKKELELDFEFEVRDYDDGEGVIKALYFSKEQLMELIRKFIEIRMVKNEKWVVSKRSGLRAKCPEIASELVIIASAFAVLENLVDFAYSGAGIRYPTLLERMNLEHLSQNLDDYKILTFFLHLFPNKIGVKIVILLEDLEIFGAEIFENYILEYFINPFGDIIILNLRKEV